MHKGEYRLSSRGHLLLVTDLGALEQVWGIFKTLPPNARIISAKVEDYDHGQDLVLEYEY